ncbi:MAG: CHRD domain-containing protein [Betaproteobacteria bacterium]
MIQFKTKSATLISALLCVLATPVLAQSGDTTERAAGGMTGYQETPAAVNSPGSGEFFIHVHPNRAALDYELRYRGLTGVTQSHIHFGRPGVAGSIVLYLCSNLAPPAGVPVPQTCPTSEGILTGTLTAANIVAQSTQGIAAGAAGFAAILKAIQDGSTYANLHTTGFPGGEIRGGIKARGPFFN